MPHSNSITKKLGERKLETTKKKKSKTWKGERVEEKMEERKTKDKEEETKSLEKCVCNRYLIFFHETLFRINHRKIISF